MSTDMVRQNEFGKEHGLVHEVLVTGRKVGADKDFWSCLAHDEKLFAKVVGFVKGKDQPTVRMHRAAQIMGRNFIGISEAKKYFGAYPSENELENLFEVPWSASTLEQCKDTHILVVVFPISIADIWGRSFVDQVKIASNIVESPVYHEQGKGAQWVLIRKTSPLELRGKTILEKEVARLGEDYVWVSAQVMAYTASGYLQATDEKLFPDWTLLTSSKTSDGYPINLSQSDKSITISHRLWGGKIGLACSRKPYH